MQFLYSQSPPQGHNDVLITNSPTESIGCRGSCALEECALLCVQQRVTAARRAHGSLSKKVLPPLVQTQATISKLVRLSGQGLEETREWLALSRALFLQQLHQLWHCGELQPRAFYKCPHVRNAEGTCLLGCLRHSWLGRGRARRSFVFGQRRPVLLVIFATVAAASVRRRLGSGRAMCRGR